MSKSIAWGVAAGVLVLALLLAWQGFSSVDGTSVHAPTGGALPDTRGAGPVPGDLPTRIGQGGVTSLSGDGASQSAATAKGFKPAQPGAPSLQSIQNELQALSASGRQPSPMEVDAVLAKLEQNQGGSVVGGYNLKALRANMQAAERIRVLADQMQELTKDLTPENTQKLMDLMKDIQKVQGGMRFDITASKP